MPTYEYKCRKCSLVFERFQKMSDEPVKTCPRCGGEVERLISAGGGVIFKGSGFYSTDYRSESYKKKEREESGSSFKDDKKGKSGSKTQSK